MLSFAGPHKLISRKRFHVQQRSIHPWKALGKAGDIGYFNFQSVPFSILKNVENGTEKIACSVFRIFTHEKWNGPEIKVACVTRLFETRLGIYRSPLYVKVFSRYKRKTKAFHFPRGSFSAYISKELTRRVDIDISPNASWSGGWHKLLWFPVRSIFHG